MRLGEVDGVARMGQGRARRTAGFQHRRDAFVVEMVGVKDQVDAGARGVKRSLAAAGMRHRLFAQSMDLADHDLGLVLGEGGDELAVVAALDAVKRDLDAIDAVLDLAADLLDRLGGGGDELADRGFGRADPGRVPVGQTLMRRQVPARRP